MKTQKIIEKQNELNKLYEKCLRYRDDLTRRGEIALSGDYIRDIEYANKLRKELAQLKAEAEKEVSDEVMYDYISFANYFHKWKEKIQRGECPIRPDEVFNEWQTSEYRKECKAHRDNLIKKG